MPEWRNHLIRPFRIGGTRHRDVESHGTRKVLYTIRYNDEDFGLGMFFICVLFVSYCNKLFLF